MRTHGIRGVLGRIALPGPSVTWVSSAMQQANCLFGYADSCQTLCGWSAYPPAAHRVAALARVPPVTREQAAGRAWGPPAWRHHRPGFWLMPR